MRKPSILLFVFSCLLFCAAAQSSSGRDIVHIVILHVNDDHGQLLAHDVLGKSRGGAARLATLIARIRKETVGDVLVLHAGDFLSRGDSLTTLSGGELNVKIMNRIGFDALTPGNGEYYTGIDHLMRLQKIARFPFIAANVYSRTNNRLLMDPFITKTINGITIAILGLGFIHEELPSARAVELRNYADIAARITPDLRKKADLVIALTHIGLPDDVSLAMVNPDIDLIVGGHTHTILDAGLVVKHMNSPGACTIAQAGEFNEYLGRIDIRMQRSGPRYRLLSIKARLISVDSTLAEDDAVAGLINSYRNAFRRVVCRSDRDISRTPNRMGPIDTLVAKAISDKTRASVVLFAHNAVAGGLRKGPVTYSEVCRLYPWGNSVVALQVPGRELIRLSSMPGYSSLGLEPGGSDSLGFAANRKRIIGTRQYLVAAVVGPDGGPPEWKNYRTTPLQADMRAAIVREIKREYRPRQ